MNNNGISIILYPRSYNKRGDVSLHSVRGVTHDGKEINIKLRLDEAPRDIEKAPSIAEFSREDRRAKQACIATPDNGPDNREGVLLFSRAHSDGTNKKGKGIESYVAKWATVLASDSDNADPIIGLGRMEIKESNSQTTKIRREINALNESGGDTSSLEKKLSDPENFNYPAIIYYPKEMIRVESGDIESFRDQASSALRIHTLHGITGGLMIRNVDNDGKIFDKSYVEFFSRFKNSEQKYQTPEETIDYFIKNNKQYFNSDNNIEFIPIVRINNGPRGNKYYGKNQRYNLTKKTYYDEDGNPLLCDVAVRVTVFDDTDNTLLSRMSAVSAPLGHPMRLDISGRFSRILINEDEKLAQKKINEEDAIEYEIGLSSDSMPFRANWIIMGESPPVVKPVVKESNGIINSPENNKIIVVNKDKDDDESVLDDNVIIENSSFGDIDIDIDFKNNYFQNMDANIKEIVSLDDNSISDTVISENIDLRENIDLKENIAKDECSLESDVKSDIKTKDEKLTGMAAFLQRRNNN